MRHNWRQRNDRRTMLKSKMKHIVKNNLKVVYSEETGASHLAGQLDPVAYNIVRTETQRMMDERTGCKNPPLLVEKPIFQTELKTIWKAKKTECALKATER